MRPDVFLHHTAVFVLIAALGEDSEYMRVHTARAVGEIGAPAAEASR